MSFGLLGTGMAIPRLRIGNDSLEGRLGLASGWIERRTGVKTRPVAPPDVATSDLAVEAGAAALRDAGIDPGRVGLVLLATSTPDHPLPPSAPSVAARLGCHNAGAVDVAGACAGFLYSLSFADNHCRASGGSTAEHVVVIGANILSRRLDPADKATVSVFGDGAGAAVWGPRANLAGSPGLAGMVLASEGSGQPDPSVRDGGSRHRIDENTIAAGHQYMRINDGGKLFRDAIRQMSDCGQKALLAAGLRAGDIDHFLPHQANRRVLTETARRLGFPLEKTIITVDRYANSSAATIPTALALGRAQGTLEQGQRVLLTAVGAGMISAAAVLTV